MPLRLVQLTNADGRRRVAADLGHGARCIDGLASVYELALAALAERSPLEDCVRRHVSPEPVHLELAAREGRLLPPIDHPDPAHLLLSGTGLTHLGSAETRDRMHREAAGEQPTDSLRMFRMGVEGGKPADGRAGVQPEWFYKGDGSCVVGTGAALVLPDFAEDGSEEPELAGIYVIDDDGCPRRLGFCLANEFSDHVTERHNYLWLAHSKLRTAALGPELLTAVPDDIRGTSRILRQGETLWEKPFWTGEANMSHSIANLEHHHFKYRQFRRPGDVHVHFFGTATLSFADGVRTRAGDVFEIEAPPFALKLVNPLAGETSSPAAVRPL
ncbi:MAG TPA: AraD1 family protein [Gammaproteobacteria bacterium]